MKKGWRELPPIAKFSIIAFVITLIAALLSLGLEGALIYYTVEFALPVSMDSLHGDAVWPTVVLAGMTWSVSFLIAGLIASKINNKSWWLVYILILWLWAYLVWWILITFQIVQ